MGFVNLQFGELMPSSLPKWSLGPVSVRIIQSGYCDFFFPFYWCERARFNLLLQDLLWTCFAPILPHFTKRHRCPPIPSSQIPGVLVNFPLLSPYQQALLLPLPKHPFLSTSSPSCLELLTVSRLSKISLYP